MKKFRKIMAILVAALMIVAMAVPAWAAATSDNGRLEDNNGKITIKNAKIGETYTVYRLFELASFDDDDIATGTHADGTEKYSYVIKEGSPWWNFLTGYGPNGSSDENKYAVQMTSTQTEAQAYDANINAYFLIQPAKVSIKTGEDGEGEDIIESDYHVIKAGKKFAHTTTAGLDDTVIPPSLRTLVSDEEGHDADGTPKGNDYVADTTVNKIVQDFAQEALKYANLSTLASDAKPAVIATVPADSEEKVLVENLPLGYYLIGSSMGTLAALDTTNSDVDVYEKNDEPALEKAVRLKTAAIHSTTPGDWVVNTDGDIGDYIEFRTIITAQQGADKYILHDVMEDGLEFVDAVVSINGTETDCKLKVDLVRGGEGADAGTYAIENEVAATAQLGEGTVGTKTTNWVLTKTSLSGGQDFTLEFKDADGAAFGNDKVSLLGLKSGSTTGYSWLDVKDGDKLYVYYFAKIKNTAVVFGTEEANENQEADKTVITLNDGTSTLTERVQFKSNDNQRNDNYAVLTYGEKKAHTPWVTASVTTYQFEIAKTDIDNVLLGGAEFELYKVEAGTSSSKDFTINGQYFKKKTGNPTALSFTASTGTYVYDGDGVNTGTLILNSDDGVITVKGLEAGTYVLKETLAPKGYDKLAYEIAITINGDGDNDGNKTTPATPAEGSIYRLMVSNNNKVLDDGTTATSNWKVTLVSEGEHAGEYSSGGVQVINTTGKELPSTGGMGTTVLYIVGGMLVILAGAYLFFSRKRTA